MAANTGKKKSGTTRRKAASGAAGKSIGIGTISLGAAVAAAAAAAFAAFRLRRPSSDGEHVPTDLLGDAHPGPNDRAPEAFRPDPTAPVPAGERDAFRPALAGAAAPTLVKGAARENERLDAAPS